jgi:16S rRNA processing protein RimM
MAYEKHILLGKITKVHGYEGAVTIRLERSFSENLPKMESVFIETDGRPVPFFIEYSEQPDLSILRLKFTDYHSTEKVKEFVGCKLYSTKSSILNIHAENTPDLIDFEVFSDDDIHLGIITGIIKNPGQLLLNVVSGSGKEILLPLHENLIIGIDSQKKIIRMIIPEGISDIN